MRWWKTSIWKSPHVFKGGNRDKFPSPPVVSVSNTFLLERGKKIKASGVFEAMVYDLRIILRLTEGRTEQSNRESGNHAGYDGVKRCKGSKPPIIVDTLGHLLALQVISANEQDHSQVGELVQQVQSVTWETVKVAFVDQGLFVDDNLALADVIAFTLRRAFIL